MSKQLLNQLSIRKRSFLLVELLVSLTLIVLCLFPLLKPLAAMRKNDQKYLRKIQLDQAYQVAYGEVKTKLYAHEHSWEDLKRGADGELDLISKILISPQNTLEFSWNYKIKSRETTKKPSFNKHGMVVDITLIPSLGRERTRTAYLEQEVGAHE